MADGRYEYNTPRHLSQGSFLSNECFTCVYSVFHIACLLAGIDGGPADSYNTEESSAKSHDAIGIISEQTNCYGSTDAALTPAQCSA